MLKLMSDRRMVLTNGFSRLYIYCSSVAHIRMTQGF